MKYFIISLIFIITFSSCEQKEELAPPNILWIVSEDNSPFLGCYGDTIATTPNLDKLSSKSIVYDHAYANAPVCAPARNTLITGMYPISSGTENMRSSYPSPDFVHFYPHYLKKAGYYTTNNYKKDYNTVDQPEVWDESSKTASYRNRQPNQPFFHIQNLKTTHESVLHKDSTARFHDPAKVILPPYHPDTEEVRSDWAVYYDQIQRMDEEVGEILKELKEDGLAENTIVFYYSDHGGVLPRSKRFLFESGLKVPLMVHVPKKYVDLISQNMGTRSDRVVSFVDFAPTLLNLAGVEVPEFMQGKAFLGKNIEESSGYAFSFRGRMDERTDLSRSITDGKYRYTRNYMPHRPYGQYLNTLWKAPSMQSWEEEFKKGNLNEIQEAFFLPKPYEELYDLANDPHNIHNLADNPDFQETKDRLSNALDQWQIEQKDAGLIPESLIEEISLSGTVYDKTHQSNYNFEELLQTAKMAASGNAENVNTLIALLSHDRAEIRYWAATGLLILQEKAIPAREALMESLANDPPSVSITSAETLYHLGDKKSAVDHLTQLLDHDLLMVRVQAMNALDYMGDEAKESLPTIKKLIKPKKQRTYDNRLMWRLVEKFNDI